MRTIFARKAVFVGLLFLMPLAWGQVDYGTPTSRDDYLKLPVGSNYVSPFGSLMVKSDPGKQDVLVSHKPGCKRDPAVNRYQPIQSRDCREEVLGPVFVYPDAPPIKFATAAPQTHGLNLSNLNVDTSKAYFKWLCENEAGEWVYRRVDDVDSLFAMRNRLEYDYDWRMFDRYYSEDPWGQISNPGTAINPQRALDFLLPEAWRAYSEFVTYAVQQGFEYYERPLTTDEKRTHPGYQFARFKRPWPDRASFVSDFRGWGAIPASSSQIEARSHKRLGEVWVVAPWVERQAVMRDVQPEFVNEIRSRYGFFWRGIERDVQDRRLGIAGTEEYVIDMKTSEILALRRVFIRAHVGIGEKGAVMWDSRTACPSRTEWRMADVLHPADPIKLRGINLLTAPLPGESVEKNKMPD